MYRHQKHNKAVQRIVLKLKENRQKPKYDKWFESEIEEACYDMEIQLIAYGREQGWPLLNIMLGGDNPPKQYGNKFHLGKSPTEETKAKIRSTLIGKISQEVYTRAEEIRHLYATGKFSHRTLGRQFGVSHTSIEKILNNKRFVK